MNVKKFFCCVPIINVRQSVVVSHKSTQHDAGTSTTDQPPLPRSLPAAPYPHGDPALPAATTPVDHGEGYKNAVFLEDDKENRGPRLDVRRRSSALSQDSSVSNGRPRGINFNDIVINAGLNGSQNSLFTDRSSQSALAQGKVCATRQIPESNVSRYNVLFCIFTHLKISHNLDFREI